MKFFRIKHKKIVTYKGCVMSKLILSQNYIRSHKWLFLAAKNADSLIRNSFDKFEEFGAVVK